MIHYVDNLEDGLTDAKLLISMLWEADKIGLDVETTGLDPYNSLVLLVQIKVGDEIFILNRGKLGQKFVTNIIKQINSRNILCLGHNIKFDIKMIKHDTGIWVKKTFDTMVVESILTAGLSGKRSSLQELINRYFDIYINKEDTLIFLEMNHESNFGEREINYAATDVLYLFEIYDEQMRRAGEEKLIKIVDLECELVPVVAKMEYDGITLDKEYWAELTGKVEIQYKEFSRTLKKAIFEEIDPTPYKDAFEFSQAVAIPVKTKRLKLALESIVDPSAVLGWMVENFNTGSPKQMYSALNLAGIETPDTNEKTLNKLPPHHLIDLLLEYRDYEKRLHSYGYNVIKAVNSATGRIHADFNQVGTSTGRFSCSGGVNMQNIPTQNGYREGFVAADGHSLIAVDYSQCEYRLAGALSKEEIILEAYKTGYDMHIATASRRFNVPFVEVTKEQRSAGKTINFAVLYGTTDYGLQRNLNISKKDANKLLEDFFAGYPRLTAFKNAVEDMIIKLRYSITPYGRKRYFKELPPFFTPAEVKRNEARMRREGFNMVIQGGTADVLKIAMINIGKNNPFGDKFKLLLQVHDELVAEVHDSIIKEATDFMKYEMVSAFQPFLGQIPAVADEKISKRWTKS
jgi:DNA polymerase-1